MQYQTGRIIMVELDTISLEMQQINPIEAPQSKDEAQFTVVGAGVIGLLTATELAQQGHRVTVVSNEGQPSLNTDSTSSNAVGQFLPWLPEGHADRVMSDFSDELDEVVEHSREFYAELARNPEQTGVMPVRNVELVSDDLPWPEALPGAMNTEKEKLDKPIVIIGPDGQESVMTDKYVFDTFSINPRKATVYLAGRAAELGVNFVAGKITPEELADLEGIIINATGAGAKDLTGDGEVEHYKGHTIIVRPKEGHALPSEALSVDDLIMMPREDGTAVIGALYIDNPDRPTPKETEADELLERVGDLLSKTSGIVQDLDPNLLNHAEILQHSAGYRVVLKSGGIRIAPDENSERLLHAYGFSGIGWSVGPVFAKRIADHAVVMHSEIIKEES